MNREKRSIVLACTIGDGYIAKLAPLVKIGRLRIRHAQKQEPYILWKAEQLTHALSKPVVVAKINNNDYDGVEASISHPYLRIVRKWLYRDDRKSLTPTLLSWLTPQGWAIWWMDDGSMYYKRNTKTGKIKAVEGLWSIHTTLEQATMIRDAFAQVSGITLHITTQKGHYVLRANTVMCKQLSLFFLPYVPDCMYYKIAAGIVQSTSAEYPLG